MVIQEKVNVNIVSRNKKYYIDRYPNIKNGDTIEVYVKDLNIKTTVPIKCQCDVCGKIKELEYRYYIKNYSKHNMYTCSVKCAKQKTELTNLNKYGVKYHSMCSDVFIDKIKKTNLEKYGKEFYTQTNQWSEKVYMTNMNKYGEKTPLSNEEIKEKIKQTNIKKYGVKSPMMSEKVKEKVKKTNLERYGVKNPAMSDEIKEKVKKTNLKRYGYEWPNQNIDVYNKIKGNIFRSKKYKNLFYKSTYELDFIKYCELNGIEITNAPSINYVMGGVNRVYFPDFYITKTNTIVEIKSTYTYEKEKEQNLLKEYFTKKEGFNFIFIIDKNYEDIL